MGKRFFGFTLSALLFALSVSALAGEKWAGKATKVEEDRLGEQQMRKILLLQLSRFDSIIQNLC